MTEISAELLAALINDKAKSQRLAELLEQEKKNQDILAAAQADRDVASRDLAEAHRVRQEAAQLVLDVDKRRDEVTAQEEQLGAMLTSLNAEKDAFNQIRVQVEQGHVETGASLNAREADVSRRERDASEREDKLTLVERNVESMRADLEHKHSSLRAAMGIEPAEA